MTEGFALHISMQATYSLILYNYSHTHATSAMYNYTIMHSHNYVGRYANHTLKPNHYTGQKREDTHQSKADNIVSQY